MAGYGRTWIVALAALSLLPGMARAGDIPLDEPGFTKALAKLFRKALPDRQVRVKAPLTLEIKDDGKPVYTAYLDNIHGFCTRDPARCDEAAVKHVAMIAASYRGLPKAEPKLLRAVVRPAAYVDEMRRMYAGKGEPPARPLVGDLWILCALDMPQAIEMLKPDDLKQLNMTLDEAIRTGIDNDAGVLAPIEQASVTLPDPRLRLVSNNPYESSRLLLPESWAALAAKNGGQLLVAAPGVDAIIYADGRQPGAVEALRAGVAIVSQHVQRPLSRDVFRWSPAGWVVVK